MLEEGQVYVGPSGETVEIVCPYTGTVGEIYSATMSLGPVQMGVLVTEQGLMDGGFQLQ